jgi:hypothetical protein
LRQFSNKHGFLFLLKFQCPFVPFDLLVGVVRGGDLVAAACCLGHGIDEISPCMMTTPPKTTNDLTLPPSLPTLCPVLLGHSMSKSGAHTLTHTQLLPHPPCTNLHPASPNHLDPTTTTPLHDDSRQLPRLRMGLSWSTRRDPLIKTE